MLYDYNIFVGYDRLIAAIKLRVLNRGTRYQQVINPYSADDHSQHPKIEYLLFQ